MVCHRCILAVEGLLRELGFQVKQVRLGEADLLTEPDREQLEELKDKLEGLGFALIDDKRSRLIEQIKQEVIQLTHYRDEPLRVNLSDHLAEKLHYEYGYLSHLFSAIEGITIEQYAISQRVERVKELIVYDELTLSEIAWRMGYSSPAHLSSQFKKVTGLTPSHFKKVGAERRKPLDGI